MKPEAQQGIIFDINRYAIHDGPGIRTTAFLKGCPIRCRWCANPESQKTAPEIAYLKNECIRCGKCEVVCPENAIYWSGNGHFIRRPACSLCGKCVDICPSEALRIMGRLVTPIALYEEMIPDRPFWERSGGGVTLSGGEPLLQYRFIKAFLQMCKKKYIHTAIESCLHVSTEKLIKIQSLINYLICDLKIMDDEKHKKFTGVSNALSMKNISFLLQSDQEMLVRMPLIPGVNDDVTNLELLGNFLQSHRQGVQLELLPYHRLGESKYERLGRNYEMRHILPPSKEVMENARTVLRNFRIRLVKR